MRSRGPSLLTIIYVVIGIFVAIDNKYFENVDDIEAVLSAVLAVLLWPLVLLDVNLMIGSK
ncbi:MAG: hypothetical protein H0V15_01310 [Solirubrobacterales bacterium]|nr:hypothetical protein [Solirubrobacterales bacterium]